MSRFCFQERINKGTPVACTEEMLLAAMKNERVTQVCQLIASLDPTHPDFEQRKSHLKRQLPIITPHAKGFRKDESCSAEGPLGGPRKSHLAIDSGLAMLDVDHVDDPRGWFEQQDKTKLTAEKIWLVSITPSGKGLRMIGERQRGENIEAAQARMAKAFGIETYDSVTKDLARASFIAPWSYVLHYSSEGLFTEPVATSDEPEEVAPMAVPESVPETPPQAKKSELPVRYKGVPYGSIVERLLSLLGSEGGAEQGERNTVYFSLATYMRYICDFSQDLLLAVLPSFGLSEEERRQTIRSAVSRPRKNTIPMVVQTAVTLAEQQMQTLSRQELKSKAADLPLPKLPRLLSLICKRLPEDYRAAMVIAALPILGALATRVRFLYLDKQEHAFNFMVCVSASAASGKSFIRRPIDLLLTPINEQDEVEFKKQQDYLEKLRATKNAKNQPEDPHACPRNNGVTVSVARLLQLMSYSGGKHLIGIGEEMDTLLKTEKAGAWSQKSDIYRLSFDGAEYAQSYLSTSNSFSGKVNVLYNLLLTGTPKSMKRFFNDLENGLVTRVAFAQLPDMSFCELPLFEPYSKKEQEEIIHRARMLDQENGMVQCPAVEDAISHWLEEKRQQAIDADSHAADTLRRRSAVMGYRAGMLCYLMEGRISKKMIGEFATWVAEYIFRNQMEMWGELMEQELTANLDLAAGSGQVAALLEMLPNEFELRELISLRLKRNQSVKPVAIRTLLSRWTSSGRIKKIGDNRYARLR